VGEHFRNATWSGAATAVRAASGLLTALLAVRLLGPVQYGHLATALSLFVLYLAMNSAILIALVAKLMALTAPDSGNDRQGLITAATTFCILSIAVLGFLTLFLFMAVPSALSLSDPARAAGENLGLAIALMGGVTAIQIVSAFNAALIESSGRLDVVMKWQLTSPITITLILASLFVVGADVSGQAYVGILLAGATVELLLLWRARLALTPLRVSLNGVPAVAGYLKSLLKSGSALQFAALTNLFLEPFNKFVLNYFVGPVAVTSYDLAMKVIWGIQGVFGAAMRVFLHMSQLKNEVVGTTYIRTLAAIGIPVMAFHIAGTVFLSLVAQFWVSVQQSELIAFFGLATLSNLAMIFITPLYMRLVARDDTGFLIRAHLTNAVSNVVCSLVLIPVLGLVGAAAGLFLATMWNSSAIWRRYKARVGGIAGIAELAMGKWKKAGLMLLLFGAALSAGVEGSVSLIYPAVIMAGVVLLVATEPIVAELIHRLRNKII
jgi:O-antigen/teichoic acid export membrane protein